MQATKIQKPEIHEGIFPCFMASCLNMACGARAEPVPPGEIFPRPVAATKGGALSQAPIRFECTIGMLLALLFGGWEAAARSKSSNEERGRGDPSSWIASSPLDKLGP